MPRSSLLSLSCLAALCSSCSQHQVPEFEVRAINAEEEVIPCLVLLDDQVVLDGSSNEPVRAPTRVTLRFPEGPDGRPASLKLGVRPVAGAAAGDVEGATGAPVQPEDSSGILYGEESRFVAPSDSRTQLFVLRRSKTAAP